MIDMIRFIVPGKKKGMTDQLRRGGVILVVTLALIGLVYRLSGRGHVNTLAEASGNAERRVVQESIDAHTAI